MSVGFVRANVSGHYSTSGYTSDSLSFDCTSSNFLVVTICGLHSGGAPSAFSVTYGGVAMTQVTGSPFGPDNEFSEEYIAIFYLANPATGSNTISASWTTTLTYQQLSAQCYSGAGAISSIQNSKAAGGSLTVTSASSSMGFGTASSINNGSGITLTSGTTDENWYIGSPSNTSGCTGHWAGSSSISAAFTGTHELCVAFSIDVGSTAYKLSAAAGSYSITGDSPTIHHAYASLSTAPGSYAISGLSPVIRHARSIISAIGSYAITGASPTIHHTRTLIAAVGSYALSGVNVIMQHAYKLVQVAGSYAITGAVPTITSKRHLLAAAGAYVYTGVSPTLHAARHLLAAAGSYAITGSHPILSWVIAPVTKFLLRVDKPVLYMVRSVQPVLGKVRAALGSLYQTRQKPPTLDD